MFNPDMAFSQFCLGSDLLSGALHCSQHLLNLNVCRYQTVAIQLDGFGHLHGIYHLPTNFCSKINLTRVRMKSRSQTVTPRAPRPFEDKDVYAQSLLTSNLPRYLRSSDAKMNTDRDVRAALDAMHEKAFNNKCSPSLKRKQPSQFETVGDEERGAEALIYESSSQHLCLLQVCRSKNLSQQQ